MAPATEAGHRAQVAPVDVETAARIITGSGPETALDGLPLLVVDLDRGSGPLDLPAGTPLVVVGISRDQVSPSVAGVDVALSARRGAGRPWAGGSVEPDLDHLTALVGSHPEAAVVLAQTLRASETTPVSSGLVIESLAYSTLQGGPEFRRWLESRSQKPRAADENDPVVLDRHGDRLSVTLNRPAVHNSYNAAMRDALCDALALVTADETIRSVDWYGAGASFCSGGDLVEFGSFPDPATAHLIRVGQSPARLIAQLSGKITAHLHGSCIGSGIELPAFARTVLTAADTQIRLPEVGMGLIPGAGGTVSIPRRIGRHRTAWLALTGRTIDAETALAWGLADGPERPDGQVR
jgi:enoyl-CoA hydratase/carnithine racemase